MRRVAIGISESVRTPLAILLLALAAAGIWHRELIELFDPRPLLTVEQIVVTVEAGRPTRVAESRTIHRPFKGTWRVRVTRVGREGVRTVCVLPPVGSNSASYSPSAGVWLDLGWHAYIGDLDGSCTARLEPGEHVLTVLRTAEVGWLTIDLPPAVSAPFRIE